MSMTPLNGRASALAAYPVGSIYMSVNGTSPATLFGGTWSQVQGRFLLACDSSHAAGSVGGEAMHTLTVSEMPAHTHPYTDNGEMMFAGSDKAIAGSKMHPNSGYNAPNSPFSMWEYGTGTRSSGGGAAHNNMPPYLAVYMWRRMA